MRSEFSYITGAGSNSKSVLFYKNGDCNFHGHRIAITERRFRNFDNLLNELTRITKLSQGARYIFTPVNGNRIVSLSQLYHGQAYVCGSYPKLKKINYGYALDGSSRKRVKNRNCIPTVSNINELKIENEIRPSNIKPKIVTIIRNGVRRPKKCVKILLNKRTAQTYDQVLNDIASTVGVEGGCVRKLYNIYGKLVLSLSELFGDDFVFVAVGNERLRTVDLPLIREDLCIKTNNSRTGNIRKMSKSTSPLQLSKVGKQKKQRKICSHRQISSKDCLRSPILPHKKLPTIKPVNNSGHNTVTQTNSREKKCNTKELNTITEMHRENFHIVSEENIIQYPVQNDFIQSIHSNHTFDNNAVTLNKKIPLPSIKPSHSGSPITIEQEENHFILNYNSESDFTQLQRDNKSPITSIKSIDTNVLIIDSNEEKIEKDKSIEFEFGKTKDIHINMDLQKIDTVVIDKMSSLDIHGNSTINSNSLARDSNIPASSANKDSSFDVLSNESADNEIKENELLGITQTAIVKSSSPLHPLIPLAELSETDANIVSSKYSEVGKNGSAEKNSDRNCGISEKSTVMRYTNHQLSSSDEINSYYEFSDTLGDGNFAVVKLGKERKSGMTYAVKIIDVSKIKGKEEMLKNEILIQRNCHHPNIVQLFHDLHSSTEIFLVMELMTGGDFFDLIAEKVRLEEENASAYVRDLCSGLDYLHRRNIVHRDIKPENLLVCQTLGGSTVLKIADFGLAQEVTNPIFTICGTPTYVSPEILKEEGYGLEVDIWAAGVIIYIMLCGFPPFRSPNRRQSELFDLIETGEFEFTTPYWDDISDSAKDLITHMLMVNVNQRLTSKQVLEHFWLRQYGLIRSNTIDHTPRRSMFKIVAKSIQSVERMKKLAGTKLMRDENFI